MTDLPIDVKRQKESQDGRIQPTDVLPGRCRLCEEAMLASPMESSGGPPFLWEERREPLPVPLSS
jgi:hypothetical protein